MKGSAWAIVLVLLSCSGQQQVPPSPESVAWVTEPAATARSTAPEAPDVPAAPTEVIARAGDAQAILSWTTPLGSARPIIGYTVSRSDDAAVLHVTGTEVTVTGLQNGTSYTFSVAAVNEVGKGPSASSNAVTPLGPPTAPVGVLAGPAAQGAMVSWRAPRGNGGSPVLEYEVISTPGGVTAVVAAPATRATMTGLSPGKSYTFRVRAKNAVGSGAHSLPSNEVASSSACAGATRFGSSFLLSTGLVEARSLVAGDFDSDGRDDVAVCHLSGGVRVFLATAGRGFGAPSSFMVPRGAESMAAADLDGDGQLDLVVTGSDVQSGAGTISVLRGTGTGSFHPPTSYPVGAWPKTVTTGDVNSDGRLDVVVGHLAAGVVGVLLGGAGGVLLPAVNFPYADDATSLTLSDFDGDHDLDLAAAGIGGVKLMLGNGDGGFAAATAVVSGTANGFITSGDFNGDGAIDLAVGSPADSFSESTIVLAGNGDGTFQPPVSHSGGGWGIRAADFNADGVLDLAGLGRRHVSVVRGSGNGTFGAASRWLAVADNEWETPWAVTSGDFDADGRVDVAVLAYNLAAADNVRVSFGNGDGTFTPTAYPAGDGPSGVAAGDFDRDGRVDVAVALRADDAVGLLLGTGDGGLAAATLHGVGSSPSALAAADFDGDGRLDLAVANHGSNDVSVLMGVGTGGFSAVSYAAGSGPAALLVGDFNADGRVDLAVANALGTDVSVLLARPAGGFLPAIASAAGAGPTALAAGDFDRDGLLDLFVTVGASSSGRFGRFLLGNGDGSFRLPVEAAAPPSTSIATGDFNADDIVDFATAGYYAVWVGAVAPDGGVSEQQFVSSYPAGGSGSRIVSLVCADLDGNGLVDCATGHDSEDTIGVLWGGGSVAPFNFGVRYPVRTVPNSAGAALAAADFDGDGRLDLVVANPSTDDVSLLLNTCTP